MSTPTTQGQALLQGAKEHQSAFVRSGQTHEAQVKRLSGFTNREVTLTLHAALDRVELAERNVASRNRDWDSINCPRIYDDKTFTCIVKHTGVSRGRSYLIFFVTETMRLETSLMITKSLFVGYEYRLWLDDVSKIEVVGET